MSSEATSAEAPGGTRGGTRERILAAAHALLVETGDPTTSMAAIGKRAGVSRQAVYLHFESRTELLLALVRWIDESRGLGERLREAGAVADPAARAESIARASARYEAEIREAALALEVARHGDAAAAAAWEDRMSGRRRHWTGVFRELAAAGRLRQEWTPERAGEAYWSLTLPGVYRALVEGCGWSEAAYEEWAVELLRRLFVVPESQRPGRSCR